MRFEPTTLRDLVGCSNHLSYWRLYGEHHNFRYKISYADSMNYLEVHHAFLFYK